MNQSKAVIFDMDGVIVDSEPRHERAFLEVVREIGYGDKLGLRFDDYIGRSDQDLWLAFIAKHKPLQPFEELLALKTQRVVELIRREQPVFKDLGRFFSAVVSCSDIQRGKPAPDIFLRAAELLKVLPQHCCVIEDSKPGIAAGLAAGMEVIAITNTHPAAELHHATHVVQAYQDIEHLLLEPR